MRNHGRGNRTWEDGFIGRGIGMNGAAGETGKWGARREEGGGGGEKVERSVEGKGWQSNPAAAAAAAACGGGSGGGVGVDCISRT